MSESQSSPPSVAKGESEGFGVDTLNQAERTEWMRQVNHVRKQEFAYLRSVQRRQIGEIAESMLAGLPAMTPRADKMRGDTLKKIDEIEAQLDLLWVSSRSKRSDSEISVTRQFTTSMLGPPSVLTQTMHHSEIPSSVLLVQSLENHTTKSAAASEELIQRGTIARSQSITPQVKHLQDEVLIKAAELFAQAEYDLAAQHLTRSLRGTETRAGHALQRLLALLDIYRATGNQAQFDWSVLEYFDFWEGNTPQWQRRSNANRENPTPLSKVAPPKSPKKWGQAHPNRKWRCPSVLNRIAADALQALWLEGGICTADWTSLSTIEVDAAAHLTAVFTTEQGAPHQLMFIDTPNLLYVLEQATPIGNSQVDRRLWLLRFCLLSLMDMRVAFDAACTDFCLTYIESAPTWHPSTVEFVGDSMATVPVALAPAGDSLWYLHGHVLGETGLGLVEPAPGRVNVDCATLVRMDSSATALLLQWLHKAVACSSEVHFNDVSLLLGATWNAAGIEAFAQIHLRDAP